MSKQINPISLSFILICFFLWIAVYCPIIIYHLHKYKSRGTNIVYLLRYSNITVIQSILLIIKLIFAVFSAISAVLIFGHNTWQDDIVRAINAYLAAFFLYCFVWKFWLLRYNILLNNIVINHEWKSIINYKRYRANTTFYAKYKSTFGNTRFSMWISMILAIIITTFYVLTHIVYPEFYKNDPNGYRRQLYAGWDYVIPFILLIIIYYKTPKFEDNFYITKEMKYIFICLCIQYSSYYTYLIVMSLIYTPRMSTIAEDTIYFIEFQIVIAMQFMAMLISTYWVNQRCENIIKTHRYEIHKISSKLRLNLPQKHCIEIQPKKQEINTMKYHKKETFDSSTTTTTTKSSNNNILFAERTESGTFRDGLYDILSTSVTYNEFIKHLSKEFSIECLLSLTEMVQFRDYMLTQMDNNDNNDDNTDNFESFLCDHDQLMIDLPSDIPQSYIVENKEWNNKEKAYRLYTKYIKNGAENEINISCEQRTFYDNFMGNYHCFINNDHIKNKDLINLFNPCCHQMIYLMIDSRKRFEETAIYTKLITSI